MKAVVFSAPNGVRIADVARPTLADDRDAVVRVSLSSICGSDLHLLDGKTPGMRDGSVIGHEFVGVVEDAGPAAAVDAGDRVLGAFLIACGECFQCAADRYNFCRNRRALGLGPVTGDLDGAQAEYVRVPNAGLNLKRLEGPYASLSDEQALFGGDILATGFYAAAASEVREGDEVVVFGAGPVGLCCALAAREAKGRVIVFDQDPARIEFASEMGLEALDVSASEPADEVNVLTGGRMVDVAIDAVGAVPVVKSALRCVRDGGRVTVVGVYGAERYELPMGMAWVRGIDLRFTGMANVHAHWDAVLEAVGRGAVDPVRLITHRLPLEEAVGGYELFRSRSAMKVVLDPRGG